MKVEYLSNQLTKLLKLSDYLKLGQTLPLRAQLTGKMSKNEILSSFWNLNMKLFDIVRRLLQNKIFLGIFRGPFI